MSDAVIKEKLRQLNKGLVKVFLAEISIAIETNPDVEPTTELQEIIKDYLFLQSQLEKNRFSYNQLKELADEFRKSLALNWSGTLSP